jgi:uncharacterized membrane protein YuzA (DUF378 family)
MNRFRILALILVLLCSLTLTIVTLAQSSANYDLPWHVIGSGGSRMSSANYMVNGTLGQLIVGYTKSTNYLISQGFWIQKRHEIFLPTILKD